MDVYRILFTNTSMVVGLLASLWVGIVDAQQLPNGSVLSGTSRYSDVASIGYGNASNIRLASLADDTSDALQGGGAISPAQWPAHLQSGSFPVLPPDPYQDELEPLPDLDEELWNHGGSYLYRPEGEQLNWPDKAEAHYKYLRLPSDWIAPEPWTMFADFLGPDAVKDYPRLRWPHGYSWEPRLVGYGSYEVFATAFEQGGNDVIACGHQLVADLDLRLTGTERFHVQFRPFGEENTGGSYVRIDNPTVFVNNSTIAPQRYWFEGELHSIFSGFVDPFSPLDIGLTVGRFPFALHNTLLMNDEIVGVVLSKNTIYLGPLNNLNMRLFYGFNEVDAFDGAGAQLIGLHASADHRGVFYESTYAFASHDSDSGRNSHFAAISRTKLYGRNNISARAFLKWGDQSGRGGGELFTLEANRVYHLHRPVCDVRHFLLFANAFVASEGWTSLGGGNFNRVRTAFEVNPLVRIAAGVASRDTVGLAVGAQIFRRFDDESFVPEIAIEFPGGEPVFGIGLRYLRKTSERTFFDVLGTANISGDPQFDRLGLFLSHVTLF
ncbi:MAG: hypothetical protein ABGX22_11470 [Pirellulaceae bacterium]